MAYGNTVSMLKKPVLRVTSRPATASRRGLRPRTSSLICTQNRRTDLPDSAGAISAVVARFALVYLAELVLCDGDQPVHGWVERFGVRKLEVRGDRFFFNNKPFFVRGYGDDFVYPLTLVSPASREEHLRHFKAARQAGFLYVRLHTHCELPE